jgi:hypothetical protein
MVVRVAKYTRRSTDDENQPHSIEVQDTRLEVRQVMTTSTAATRKALLKELVAEIRVENRHTIRPWFWVPDGTLMANRQVTPENPVRNLASSKPDLPAREPSVGRGRTNTPALSSANAFCHQHRQHWVAGAVGDPVSSAARPCRRTTCCWPGHTARGTIMPSTALAG